MDAKNIKKLAKLMRSNGILYLKDAEIEISLDPRFVQSTPKTKHTGPIAEPQDGPSDEQILFWSAPGIQDEATQ